MLDLTPGLMLDAMSALLILFGGALCIKTWFLRRNRLWSAGVHVTQYIIPRESIIFATAGVFFIVAILLKL